MQRRSRFSELFIPSSEDGTGEKIRKIILIAAIIVVIVCGGLFIAEQLHIVNDEKKNEELRIKKGTTTVASMTTRQPETVSAEPGVTEAPPPKPTEIMAQYKALYEENNDMVGWVKVDGTPIDYPVVQTTDNEYYLGHDFDKNVSKFGTVFANFQAPLTATERANNVILHGHNIYKGTYFAKLCNYSPTYYSGLYVKKVPTVTFDTLYEPGTYKIYAGVFFNTRKDLGEVYDYWVKDYFRDNNEFYDFMENILDRSEFYTPVDIKPDDELLTLSTCYYPLGMDADTRFAVFGRKVRPGESAEVDTSLITRNMRPKYFKYMDKVNGRKPWTTTDRTWDPNLVEGYAEWKAKQSA